MNRKAEIKYGAWLILITLAVYLPLADAGFIWDDDAFLLRNPVIVSDGGLGRIWFSAECPDYYPLTLTSLWLEWRVWGMRAGGYHMSNVILHALAAVLLWRVMTRFFSVSAPTGRAKRAAWFAALGFALHPVNVMSVAWITERKNVLSLFFFALCLLLWARSEEHGKGGTYWSAVAAFLCSLLSKTAGVVLPPLLLAWAWWSRGRITRNDLWRSLPFWILAVAASVSSIWFQTNVAIAHHALLVRADGFWARLAGAGWAAWFYLYKAIFPQGLCFTYPRWRIEPGMWISYVPVTLIVICLALFWRYRKSWGRPALFAAMCFLAMLFPVMGFFDIYYMRYSFVSDHWQYFAIVAPIALLVGGGLALQARIGRKRLFVVVGAITALALGLLTFNRQWQFRDSHALWRAAARCNQDSWLAWVTLGASLKAEGNYHGAISAFDRAVVLAPCDAASWELRGECRAALADYAAAISDYDEALAVSAEGAPSIWLKRAKSCLALGDVKGAIYSCDQAEARGAEGEELYKARARAYYETRAWESCVADCVKALCLPDASEILLLRARALLELGRPREARGDVVKRDSMEADVLVELREALESEQ